MVGRAEGYRCLWLIRFVFVGMVLLMFIQPAISSELSAEAQQSERLLPDLEGLGAVTVKTRLSIGDGFAVGSSEEICLIGLGEEQELSGLCLKWKKTIRNWVRDWTLVLEAKDGLLDGPISLGQVKPENGHTYETTLSYDPRTGWVSIVVYDCTLDKKLYAGFHQAEPLRKLGCAGTTANNNLGSDNAVVDKIEVYPVFVPAGVEWEIVEISDVGMLAVSRIDRSAPAAIRLKSSQGTITGTYRFFAIQDGRKEQIAEIVGGETIASVDLKDLRMGKVIVMLVYGDDNQVYFSQVKELGCGNATSSLRNLEIDWNSQRIAGRMEIIADGALADLDLECHIDMFSLEWDQELGLPYDRYCKSITVPFDESFTLVGSTMELPFSVPLDDFREYVPSRLSIRVVAKNRMSEIIISGAHEAVLSNRVMDLAVSFPLPTTVRYETRCMLETIQGIVNRTGPRLYFTTAKEHWLDIYAVRNGISYRSMSNMVELLHYFRNDFKGLVVYDDRVDGSRYVALTVAGLSDLVPVNQALLDEYEALFRQLGLSIQLDLRGKFGNSVEAYQWALEEVMPRTNRGFAHAVNGEVDGIIAGNGPFAWFDWVIANRGFIFNLSCAPTKKESWGNQVGGCPEQALMYERILAALGPMAQIKGFGEPEWDWVSLLASYGHYSFHWGGNLSFHSKVSATKTPRQNTHYTPESTASELDRHLVAFMISEGDTMKGPITFWSGSWFDPFRGSVAINWGINPLMAEIAPAMLEYYYDTATSNDYFFAGVSGAGYTSIKHMNEQQVEMFAYHTAAAMKDADIRCIDVWQWENYTKDLQRFTEITGVLGLTLLTSRPPALLNGVPLVGHNFAYWNASHTNLADTAEELAQKINVYAKTLGVPGVIPVYTDMQYPSVNGISNLPQLHQEIAEHLGSVSFRPVRLDEAFSVLRRQIEP